MDLMVMPANLECDFPSSGYIDLQIWSDAQVFLRLQYADDRIEYVGIQRGVKEAGLEILRT